MKEIIEEISDQFGITKKLAKEVIDATIHSLTGKIVTTGEVSIAGFGKFVIVTRPERNGRNPKTNTPLIIKEHKAVKFKIAKALKESIQ